GALACGCALRPGGSTTASRTTCRRFCAWRGLGSCSRAASSSPTTWASSDWRPTCATCASAGSTAAATSAPPSSTRRCCPTCRWARTASPSRGWCRTAWRSLSTRRQRKSRRGTSASWSRLGV
ncbi:unnamed protein product, partial [Prorocentrum cordatum]